MKSSLKNMVLVLGTITLISSACVGLVYMITAEPIAAAKEQAVNDALAQVLPAYDNTEKTESESDGLKITTHTATLSGEVVGYAVESASKSGFGGTVRLMVGFNKEGKIVNINVLEQKETPGLGTKMCDAENPLLKSFKYKSAAEVTMKVRKDGGDVDALTAATISSRAYTEAVARAYEAYKVASGLQSEANAVSGATPQQREEGGYDGK